MKDDSAKDTLEPAKSLALKEAVTCAAQSIVSKTLVDRKTGTLTLFAFDQGQGLSEHTAPFDALVQVLEGEVQLTIGGLAVSAREGQIVLMPANVPHALRATTAFKMLLYMIRSGTQ